MKHIEYKPQGVCSRLIKFDITDDNKISNLVFVGGCPGNLSAIGKLLEGMDADKAVAILKGNKCGYKNTSCADQFTKAVEQNM